MAKKFPYTPLVVIICLTLLASLALQIPAGGWELKGFMHGFMGLFLLTFAMLKLFDVTGFADGFQKYDLLAKRSRSYAVAYPFIEFILGIAYLTQLHPRLTYLATFVVTGFGAIGVIHTLRSGLNVNCACLGTSLRVPLSTVALTEDMGMAGMALAMLFIH
jgi:hypothetical protein